MNPVMNTATNVEPRQHAYLKRAATADLTDGVRSALLSRLWAGDAQTAETWINALLDECDQHVDCTDFRLNTLLRALLMFGEPPFAVGQGSAESHGRRRTLLRRVEPGLSDVL